MNTKKVTISYESFKSINDLSSADRELCERAEQALASSHSPYSHFKVGTSIRLQTGEFFSGSNQENVAYPSGLCAERVALFTIGAAKPDAIIEAMAITAQTSSFTIENPVTSCGACLQVMAESEKRQNSPITVLFYCLDGEILKIKGIKNLLPFGFVEDRLGMEE